MDKLFESLLKIFSFNASIKPVNTLAQNGTRVDQNLSNKAIIINGNGSELNNQKAIKGRAKRKMITQKMVLSLVDVAKKKENLKQKKAIGILIIVKTKYIQ